MVIDELHTSASYRLAKVLKVLESQYALSIDFGAAQSRAELESIYEEYGLLRSKIINESAFNSYSHNPEYSKACLVQEAITIFLSEVAPKRRPRRAKNSA
jgi:hypothetical protein